MTIIFDSIQKPECLEPFSEWLKNEWGSSHLYDKEKHGIAIPPALFALEDDQLVGGLTFTRYPHPQNEQIALWVNAIIVPPEHRKKGIASALIKAAENASFKKSEKEIFALTDVPQLYSNCGWQHIAKEEENEIMGIRL